MNIYNSLRFFILTIATSSELAVLNVPNQIIPSYLNSLNHRIESAIIDVEDLDYNQKIYNTVYSYLYDRVGKNPAKYGFTKQELADKMQMNVIERVIHEIALCSAQY